jgi:hypothetical protein
MKKSELQDTMLRRSDDLVLLAKKLGYDTYPQQLICSNGASVSGLLNFFDDNPGAMEAVQNWVLAQEILLEEEEEEEEAE